MLDSIHTSAGAHLQLGEGVLLRGVDADGVMNAGDPAAALAQVMQDESRLLGATRDGCVFRCTPDMLDTTRGCRTPMPGETLVRRWTVTLSGTLLEISPGNAAMLLNLPQSAPMAPPCPPVFAASADTLCWFGMTGSGLMAIELHCPVSTGGMALRTARSGFGEMPFTLLAHRTNTAGLPCRLLWPKEATT